ncbi:hypothetical protein Bca4012_050258 [Brassica carinata]|uniref:(rape) hypothetical protein n=1 Tax=Brassica napus TaxID=3708 RepID=A0A816WZH1_BRANA|nr:unnamed protein product [Brassica napus]
MFSSCVIQKERQMNDDMADIRELHDEDFISDAEEKYFCGTNLESDEDQVPNMYGEEEYDD